MFIINCPWCGKREQSEFSAHGEAHIARPEDPENLDDAQWAEYVFFRNNTKGIYHERWVHSAGCGKWFNILRDTATDRILTTYPAGTAPPDVAKE